MSQYNRTTKPDADKTIPEAEIFAVDRTELGFTNGVSAPGWVRRRAIGDTRIVHETLVAMKTPPTDEDFEEDDDDFPDEARVVAISGHTVETLDDDGETWTDEELATLDIILGQRIRLAVAAGVTPTEDVLKFKWQTLIAEATYQTTIPFRVGTDEADEDYIEIDTGLLDLEGGVEDDGAYNYKVVVSSVLSDSTDEDEFDIQLIAAEISLDTDAQAESAFEGAEAEFSVEATITPAYAYTLSYQWETKVGEAAWSDVEGETDDTLTFEADLEQDGHLFRCRISATGPAEVDDVVSAEVELTVNEATTTTTTE